MKKQLNYSRGAKPLYAQVYDILVDKLHKREYNKDRAFPTETEFQEMFGISRITARRALAELVREGYVRRERGIGTQVVRNSKRPTATIQTKMLGEGDHQARRRIIAIEHIMPDHDTCRALTLADDEKVTRVIRVIENNDGPVLYNTLYLPSRVGEIDEKLIAESLYLFLEIRGQNVERYTELLSALLPDAQQQRWLNVTQETPLLVRTRTGYNQAGEAVVYSISCHISQYFEYRVEGY